MAIFQPTNIIPSSFTQGTVDVNDNMEISWQVNGNSAMTAFQIDFYLNDTASAPVYSTGRQTDNCPFYGTDRFGRPQFFTYNAQRTWEEVGEFTNGNNYKFKITQFFAEDKDEYNVKTAIEYTGGDYYFQILDTLYALFTLPSGSYPIGTQVFYNTRTKQGYYLQGNQQQFLTFTESTTQPTNGANLGNATNEVSIEQTSFATFITRSTPTLSISTATYADFSGATTPLINGSSYAKSVAYFIANYVQEQGDSIRWIRWQVATATYNAQTEKYTVGDILADTGDIYTPTLNFEFNGFFNGSQYAIRCFGESESGQSCDTGWIFFNINYTENTYTGNFIAQCLNQENATLLEWEGVEVILPTVTGNYTLNNGSVKLPTNSRISWQQTKGNEIVPFTNPWTAVWKGELDNSDDLSTKLNLSGTTSELATTVEKKIVFTGETYRVPGGTPDYDLYGGIFTQPLPEKYLSYDEDSVIVHIISGYQTRLSRIWVEGNQMNIEFVNVANASSVFEVIVTAICANEYKTTVSETVDGTIFNYKDITASSNVTRYNISYAENQLTAELFSENPASVFMSLTVEYTVIVYGTQGTLLTLNGANLTLSRQDNPLILKLGNTQLASITVPDSSTSVAVVITSTTANAYFYAENELLEQTQQALTYTQQPITFVQISGGDSGATVESVSVYQGDGSNVLPLYEKPNFEPVWNDANYGLYMTANFNGNIQGGTGNAEGNGFQVYRREVGGSVLTPIANVSALTTSLKDYGIRSRKAYEYLLGVYDSNKAFMGIVTATKPNIEPKETAAIATNFKNYSLLVCDYDYDKDEYHVRKQYLFALNLTSGSVGNNNSPTLNKNFTQYPTRMPDTANYKRGTLSGLIGAIYTAPALIEQIGQYKYTAKPSTLDYFDSVDLEKELYDLSTAPYQLFLRDMKGRLRMIATNGAISMTTNIKQKQQSISISFPWVEVGDASDVTIIQTPDDYGWNNDNEVLDVQLDVDVETGELSATYPFPYNGTKFYLTGVNKENLTAKTPIEVTPAQFNLSDTATKTTDGEVTATVAVNSETNSNN